MSLDGFLFIFIVIDTWWMLANGLPFLCLSSHTDIWFGKWMPFQVLGAFWYLVAIERQDTCWREACSGTCKTDSLYCPKVSTGNRDFLGIHCPIIDPDGNTTTPFDFGIFLPALQSKIVQSRDFPQKFFYCFWWGLRNLRFVVTKVPLSLASFKSNTF